jgi:hypothetical protein
VSNRELFLAKKLFPCASGSELGITMYCSSVRATGSMRFWGIVLFGNGCGTPLIVFSGS